MCSKLPFVCYRVILCCRAVSVCLSVCLSVMFVYCVNMSNHILICFSPSSSHTILVFLYQTLWQCSEQDPLTGAKIAIFNQSLALESITAGPSRVVNITALKGGVCLSQQKDDKRHASHKWILSMTASCTATPKRTEQNSIVRIGESEAEITVLLLIIMNIFIHHEW